MLFIKSSNSWPGSTFLPVNLFNNYFKAATLLLIISAWWFRVKGFTTFFFIYCLWASSLCSNRYYSNSISSCYFAFRTFPMYSRYNSRFSISSECIESFPKEVYSFTPLKLLASRKETLRFGWIGFVEYWVFRVSQAYFSLKISASLLSMHRSSLYI
jgi:hypothetical protein